MGDPMAIDKKLIDQLLTDYKETEDIIGENGLLKELTKAILETSARGRDDRPSGLREARPAGHHRATRATGKAKRLEGRIWAKLELETPRDRQATFDPKIVAKGPDALDRL